jgi:hypothetical protein
MAVARHRWRLKRWGAKAVIGLLAAGGLVGQALPAAAAPYALGDLFIGTTRGIIQHRDSTGASVGTLDTTLGNPFDTGMCFDLAGNLYATDISPTQAITKFDNMGNVVAARFVDTSGDPNNPESCIWNAANTNMFVGGPGVNQIRQYAPLTGAEVGRHTVASSGGTSGTDWVELSSDQCTVFYTNESGTIRRYNTCGVGTQSPDFATLSAACYALRIRPTTMEVLVACSDGAHLLSPTGVEVTHYFLGDVFALNLDPDGTSFWTAAPGGADVLKVDIATGSVLKTIHTGASVWGLAVFGEITAGGGGNPCSTDAAISARGATISATEGTPFDGTVATFTDPDMAAVAADYTAMINWGDTTTSAGVISGSVGGPFTVTGMHTYAEEGSPTVTVTISDSDCSTNGAAPTSTATVADAGLRSACATPPVSPQSYNGTTAGFDDANLGTHLEDFPVGNVTINWGDGHTTNGTVGGPNPYTVTGSHTYTGTGTFHIKTTINDVGGSTTSVTCDVLVFAFATGSGATFVIGDLVATPLNHVTWWGSQWAALNPMSRGPAPASMKGFAGFEDMPVIPNCPGTYTTDTGNSTPPPATVPDYMGVIVSSHITQNGSVITGDITEIAIVKTDPGYGPSPGHAGTGTVVVVIC